MTGLEDRIQERGRQLLARAEPTHLFALTPAWWQEQMLEWSHRDPDFRTRLLQFVDVLPSLRSSAAVADHVRQYFRDARPTFARVGSDTASRPFFRPVLSRAVRQGVESMSARFIAGASPEEALPRLRGLVRDGTAYTIDLLGEATLSNEEADTYRDRYLDLVERLATLKIRGAEARAARPNVSIKPSALTAHFEPAAPAAATKDIATRLVPILRRARELDVFINVDMEQYRYKDLVHHVFADVLGNDEFRDWDGVGIVVQAYLRDAPADIARLQALAERRGMPITVRLVKGAYWDEETILAHQEGHEVPVFEDKAETDRNFEYCTGLLLDAYPHLKPAFASHHPRSIAQAMVRTEIAGLPGEDVEFQVLYGMAEGLRKSIADFGYLVRVYVPCGELIPGMAYLVRRLLENTSNESWLTHKHEEADPAEVLARPVAAEHREEPPRPRFANEPHAELYLPETRDAIYAALERVRGTFGREVPARINFEPVPCESVDEIRPPAHPDQAMALAARSNPGMAAKAVDAAARAFPVWRDTPGHERAAILRRAADILVSRREELTAIMAFECAKPWSEADGDVTEAADFIRYYALQAEALDGGEDLSLVPAETNRLIHEGRGVAAVIAPWNFPLAIFSGMTCGALAAGCTVVSKPAEQSPVVASMLIDALEEAGAPPGVVQFLPGRGEEVGEALVTDPRVTTIAFTGSNAVGLHINQVAAKTEPDQPMVRKVIAELGGKNAVVVDEDADLDQAVAGVLTSAFGYAGQKCSACSRVIAVGTAYEPFRDRLRAAVESLVVGPAEDPYTRVPPVISAEAREKIEEYIAIGHQDGRLLARGASCEGGHYVAPHVFEDIPSTSRLWREEVFGPVLVLSSAASFEEGVDQALDSPFALTGGIFSRNPRNIEAASRRFRVGNFYVNRPISGSMVGRQPFAGFAMSGTGEKAGGPTYVREFTNARVITENTMRRGFAPGSRS